MGSEVETLAQFAAQTKWVDVPEAVRRHAKLVMLDTIGVILAGAHRPDARKLQVALATGGASDSGSTVLSPGWPRADARTAALLNGIAGRSIELCEGHRLASSQAAVQILPGVLAVGEQVKASGHDILAAFIIGYDVAARFCLALTARPLAHQNGQATMLGAAAAGARLRGFDAKSLSLAMRITTTLLLTPSYTNAVAGATVLNVAGGMSGFAAALAPELALAGFIAQEDSIEEALGKLVGDGFRPEAILEDLGTRWEITRNYFRLYACCNPIHPALDALQVVLAQLKPRPKEIKNIDITTYRFASVMRNPDPPNYFASKYSLPHAAATMVVRGHADYAALDDSAVNDPAIAELRHRVRITEDPAMSARAPVKRPARVTITLEDGRSGSHALETHRGDFNQPFVEEELREKFRQLAGESLTLEGIAGVERAVDQADDWASVDALFEIMRRHGR